FIGGDKMRCPNCGNEVNVGDNSEYKPISMWGYFGYEILFSIPIIGLIMLIIFSVGGTSNKNLKNFARSYFCFMILALILVIIITVLGGGSALLGNMY
ncbi:MAG: hypothetical protein K2G04_02465, partial [Oscillospiraceae bacterium]|nr:hypothetical protein [Oscillospiraceae bacterium]